MVVVEASKTSRQEVECASTLAAKQAARDFAEHIALGVQVVALVKSNARDKEQ